MLRFPHRAPWKEISSNIYYISYQVLGLPHWSAILRCVVLSFLSVQQLHTFGGEIYLINILGISSIRELGTLLRVILVACPTAQLGDRRAVGRDARQGRCW